MLKEIKKELETQDGRATAEPIFIVYDWERIPTDSAFSDGHIYVPITQGK